jgi:murein DD-endopeptidase MepM/ murein hydrolase activator NlpD
VKIILLRSSGGSHALRVSRWMGALVISTGLVVAAAWAGFGTNLLGGRQMDPQTVAHWRQEVEAQRLELQDLLDRSTAETQAVGRQLAQMQARLLRMEALGARVAEVADLDDGEFSFDQPVPVGGPDLTVSEPMPLSDLRADVDTLARNLKSRETELEILESMLRDREYRAEVAVAGRPVTWGWISSAYGERVDPFSGKMAWHAGLDFAGKQGSDVIAVASGVVTHAGKRFGYGEMVEVTHGDGYVTRYGHHAEIVVSVGEIVKKGQVIGKMGSSGRSTGPHVHFEVLKDGRRVDPARYVVRR